ncbi:acyl carrier protein [Burkholderia ambifaria]|uniref:acyl carrier protein n=1 Tax=Burkholderia ambifaria TaxID=152480 RepID=UPI00158D338A|nr:acyl carrier protein [Burkholderia ambifaria]MBR8343528.1 acyl carrier protein [Burkholderia ambifaria]
MQLDQQQVESRVRKFMVDDMVKEEARNATVMDEFDFDSLDQTELRIFLEEEYGVRFDESDTIAPFATIQDIVDFVLNRGHVNQ